MIRVRTDLTDDLAERLIEVAGKTMNWSAVARAIGKDRSTVWRWRKLAQKGVEPYAMVFDLARDAMWEHAERLLADIEGDEGPKSWQAKAWILERSMPDVFGMVPALRPDVVEETVTTSKESRLEVLEQAFGVAVEGKSADQDPEEVDVRALQDRIAELESKLEAAGG